jgi:glutaredoxin
MTDYYIKAVLLENCSYSEKAYKLLKEHNIKYTHVVVTPKTKDNYKTSLITTFPQIYLCKNNALGSQLLGGCDDLSYFIDTFKKPYLDNNKITEFMNKYKWSKKGTLKLIQIINNITINHPTTITKKMKT